MRFLKNKRGVSYVLVCVIVLFASMLIFVGMQYSSTIIAVEEQKNDTQLKLESCIMKSAIDNYDALKQGTAYTDYVDRDRLISDTYEALGFSWDMEYIQSEKYKMTRPEIETIDENGYGIKVMYELTVPFEFLDHTITEITVPVELYAEYKERG